MFKNMLVAMDGSTTSDLALQKAIGLAAELGAHLRIVHVLEPYSSPFVDSALTDLTEVWDSMRTNAEAVLEKAVALARAAGVETELKLIELDMGGGHIPDRIAEEAQAWPADVIVVGTHGRRGLSHLLLGSVAEGIARVASVPVLLIRGS